MVGVLILTHGGLANELFEASRRISGAVEQMRALALPWDISPTDARSSVLDALDELDSGEGVLILTDLYGSTPFNVARALRREGAAVDVIAGVNLAMTVRLACPTRLGQTLPEVTDWVLQKGKSSICRCRDEKDETPSDKAHDECACS